MKIKFIFGANFPNISGISVNFGSTTRPKNILKFNEKDAPKRAPKCIILVNKIGEN